MFQERGTKRSYDYLNYAHTRILFYGSLSDYIHSGTLPTSCGNIAHLETKSEDLCELSDSSEKQVRNNKNISQSDLGTKH